MPRTPATSAGPCFTGDSLFVGETGRTDLTDPDKAIEHAGQLYDSVHAKIAPLGDQTLVLPAHGAGSACGGNVSDRDDTTLGIERATNPVFIMSRQAFAQDKGSEKLPRPPYFRHMEKVNLEGGRPVPSQVGVNLLQPKMFQRQIEGRMLIDVRDPEAFAGAHLHGAYNVWLGGLSTFGGWIAADNPKIALIVDEAGPDRGGGRGAGAGRGRQRRGGDGRRRRLARTGACRSKASGPPARSRSSMRCRAARN